MSRPGGRGNAGGATRVYTMVVSGPGSSSRSRGRRACAPTRRAARGRARPAAAREPQHRHERHDARAAADEQRGRVAVPHEPAADRPADLELVADHDVVVQERRHLAVVEPLDGELDLVRVVGRRRDRVRPRRGVAVGRGEPHDVVLTGEVTASARASARRNVLARAVSGRMATTVAVCHASRSRPSRSSVALVALLEPRVAPVVVAVAFPEAGLVVVEHAQPGDPLRALPEVEVRHEQPRRAAVLDGRAADPRSPTPPTPCRPVTSASGRFVV